MSDELRNPKDFSDKKLYRVHFRDARYQDILEGDGDSLGMLALGMQRFGAAFHLSMKKMCDLEPFNVRKAGEETCVCVHHLKWHKMIQAMRRQRNLLKIRCDCVIPKTAHEARHAVMCPRQDGDKFQPRPCILQSCDNCPGVNALEMCDLERDAADGVQFRREKWMLGRPQDGSDREVYDFFKTDSDFDDLYDDIKDYASEIIEHHDLAVMQDHDWAVTQAVFPRNDFCSVQDFAMSYRHQRRVRHQSLFFQEISTTLYGAVARFHLDDLNDEYIPAAEKQSLRAGFEKHNETPIITITFIAVSADRTHDVAFVHNFNDRLTEFVKSIATPGVKWRCHHARSDGCRGQYKNSTHFYYISKQQSKTGVRLVWQFSCSCHGKDLVDPENGRAKHKGREHEKSVGDDDDKSLRTSEEFATFLQREFTQPEKSLLQKKMRGIYRREIWYIPTKGPGSVNRRVQQCDTLDGSNSLHQFEDIGIEGFLRVRARSCHRCSKCWDGHSEFCTCPEMQPYPATLVELKPLSAPTRALTRSQLSIEGISMAATVQPGDFICVEVDNLQEPWMIGRCVTGKLVWDQPAQYHWMGRIEPGDEYIWVVKLEGAGNTFTVTNKELPIFIEDVRLARFAMQPVKARVSARSSRAQVERFVLSSTTKAQIVGSMPLTLDAETKSHVRATFY
jgi:hypothetical protein